MRLHIRTEASLHRLAPHLSCGGHLLLPVLLRVELGGAADAGRTGHACVAGFRHTLSLLPRWQDLCGGGHLREEAVTVSPSRLCLRSLRPAPERGLSPVSWS